jgi:hypothetical protein
MQEFFFWSDVDWIAEVAFQDGCGIIAVVKRPVSRTVGVV